MDQWSVRRRVTSIAAVAGLLFALLLAWPALSAHLRAGALLADAVLRLPVRPLTWVTGDPASEQVTWPGGGEGLLVRPPGDGPHPALLLVLGADPAAPDDPRVERLLDGLARTGFVVLLPTSEALVDARVAPDEAPMLIDAFAMLRDDARVLDERVGFVGLSVGASLAVIAAADPAIAEEVWLVLAIGGYYDAGTLAAQVVSGQFRTGEGIAPWEPDPTAVRIVRRTLEATVPGGGAPAVAALIEGPPPSLAEAEEVIAGLPSEAQAAIDAISPRAHVAGLEAPLYLLHDRGDAFIPWTHSEELAAAYEPATYRLIDLFAHVDPAPGDAGTLLTDGWTLLRLFAEIIEAADAPTDTDDLP